MLPNSVSGCYLVFGLRFAPPAGSARRVAWFNFHSYIRTAFPQKPPSEWVVAQALRHTWPDFLCGLPQNAILKKFLATKISPARCGYLDAFGLDIAA
jgi:hypothetical protein